MTMRGFNPFTKRGINMVTNVLQEALVSETAEGLHVTKAAVIVPGISFFFPLTME